MRLNKLSELIHSSATHQHDVTYASVEVHFHEILDDELEPDLFDIVPGSSFTISRRVDRSSHSKYLLNNIDTSFKEICSLLLSKGIDLDHNRFLILQGEVEQISLMKPIAQTPSETGLLEYLEDIIGTTQYQSPISLLDLSLLDLNDQRIQRTNRVKSSLAELKSMQQEKDTATQYISKERDYMILTNMLYFVELGEGVKYYNSSIEKIHGYREELRKQKEIMKGKFV